MGGPVNTIDRIAAILREQLWLKPGHIITAQTSVVAELGCDSLDLVELAMAIEDEFRIEIPDEDAAKLVTVGDIVVLVESKKQQVAS